MTTTTLFGAAEAQTARELIGGTAIGDNRNDLLKQLLVASANKAGGSSSVAFADITGAPTDNAALAAALASAGADVQIFTEDGTWTNPSPGTLRPVRMILVAGGGGGGSGRRGAAGTNRSGGGGGGGGCYFETMLTTIDLAETEAVTVGLGGGGGTAQSANSNDGNPGAAGGDSVFDNYKAQGGNFGAGGGATSGTAGASRAASCAVWGTTAAIASAAGGAGGSGNGSNSGANPAQGQTTGCPMGGAGGGGLNTSNVAGIGGTQVAVSSLPFQVSGPNSVLGGQSAGEAGTNGDRYKMIAGRGGSGGAGGGGTGGSGASPGGGGAGGGAGTDDAEDSGAGGAGGNGIVIVITY